MKDISFKNMGQELWAADRGDGTYQNPILHGDYSDPDVIRVGEDYFLVASSFTYLPGVPLLQSKDLIHWNLINYCVKEIPYQRYEVPMHGCGVWAPSIRYYGGEFFVFIPMPDEGIFVVKTRDPYQEWSKMHCLKEARGWIDPCPFWDDDGKAYMVFAYANSRCGIKHRLSICEMSQEGDRLLTEPVIIFDGLKTNPTIEGPKLYKRDGYYYIFAPAGGVENGWQTVLRSKNIYGPYEYRIVMHQGNTRVNGPHQGGYIEDLKGEGYFLHFQDKGPYGRISHLQPVEWYEGWPFIGQEQNGDGIGEPVEQWMKPAGVKVETGVGIPVNDEFKSNELGMQWQWQANPLKEWYSFTEREGYLSLHTIDNKHRNENLLWYAPNALTQLLQAPSFLVTTEVELVPTMEGDLCGMGMTGLCYSYIGITYQDHLYYIVIYKGVVIEKEGAGKAEETLIWKKEVNSSKVLLRLNLNKNRQYTYSYSMDGNEFFEIEIEFTLTKGTWTGAKFALLAVNRNNKVSGGRGDYKYVRFEKGGEYVT